MAFTSLDGYIEDEGGGFDWAMPDPEVHAYVNDLARPAGTYLYGRRMYETMAVWQTVGVEPSASPEEADVPAVELDFADVWRAADKIVYSRTLHAVSTPRTRLEGEFDPDAVRHLKDTTDLDLAVSGPGLAQHAFAARLVDELHLFVFPVVVGGGKAGLPHGMHIDLDLLDERRFRDGTAYMRYERRCGPSREGLLGPAGRPRRRSGDGEPVHDSPSRAIVERHGREPVVVQLVDLDHSARSTEMIGLVERQR
ncbi:MAG: dihydrofolate reductase family protein [Nocardioidaceae bacterium]